VKRIALSMVGLLLAAELMGATVVLKGGKRLDVTSFAVGGSFVVVQYAGGRRESYPLSMVDLAATQTANGQKAAAPAAAEEAGPHSPFLAARSNAKTRGPVVTDADVKHIETPAAGEPAAKEEAKEGSGDAQVVLVGYDRKKVGEKEWEITATIANQGKVTATRVAATIRVLDESGKPLATASGSLPGPLEAGKNGAITVKVPLEVEPIQIACDLSWQKIVPTPAAPVVTKEGAPAAGTAAGAPKPTPVPPPFSIPKGASPNTQVYNPMAPAPPGAAPQVPPTAPPKS